jgi:sigma-B regulation protein RsbQ
MAYRFERYGSLDGYADDLLEILAALDLHDVVFVGHSISAMIGLLAANREPGRFAHLIMLGPSPRYVDDGDYKGGFSRADVEELLDLLEANHLAWSEQMAPLIMGNSEESLQRELANSLCSMEPVIARHFARVTFLSDTRAALARNTTPALIMQCTSDAIVPVAVGEYLHKHLPHSRYVLMQATGHCPHLSAPPETIALIRAYLNEPAGGLR